jgi:hypothetical protein
LDITTVDLRALLDLTIDPVKAVEALEWTCIALLGKVVDIKDTRRRVNSMFSEYNTTQGSMLAGDACGPQRDLGPLLRDRAGLRCNKHHRPTKAGESTAGATALQAGVVEITMPSGITTMASTVDIRLPQLDQELKAPSRLALMRASWLSMSTYGLTSRRHSPSALLA